MRIMTGEPYEQTITAKFAQRFTDKYGAPPRIRTISAAVHDADPDDAVVIKLTYVNSTAAHVGISKGFFGLRATEFAIHPRVYVYLKLTDTGRWLTAHQREQRDARLRLPLLLPGLISSGVNVVHPSDSTLREFPRLHHSSFYREYMKDALQAAGQRAGAMYRATGKRLALTFYGDRNDPEPLTLFEIIGALTPRQLDHVGYIRIDGSRVPETIDILPVLRLLLPPLAAAAPHCTLFVFDMGFVDSKLPKLAALVESLERERARNADAEWEPVVQFLSTFKPRLPLHFHTLRRRLVEYLDLHPLPLPIRVEVDRDEARK